MAGPQPGPGLVAQANEWSLQTENGGDGKTGLGLDRTVPVDAGHMCERTVQGPLIGCDTRDACNALFHPSAEPLFCVTFTETLL